MVNGEFQGPVPQGFSERTFRETGVTVPIQRTRLTLPNVDTKGFVKAAKRPLTNRRILPRRIGTKPVIVLNPQGFLDRSVFFR